MFAAATAASLIVGWIAVLLGSLCIITGLIVAVITALRPSPAPAGAMPWQPLTKFLEIIKGIIEALGKLPAAIQFIVLGGALFGVGAWLIAARPF